MDHDISRFNVKLNSRVLTIDRLIDKFVGDFIKFISLDPNEFNSRRWYLCFLEELEIVFLERICTVKLNIFWNNFDNRLKKRKKTKGNFNRIFILILIIIQNFFEKKNEQVLTKLRENRNTKYSFFRL